MALDYKDVWARYRYMRDCGHLDYVRKANRCIDFVESRQWEAAAREALRAQDRPALTINLIIASVKAIVARQINTRVEMAALPATQLNDETAKALTMVFKYIQRNQFMDFKTTDLFIMGQITGRGFLDIRMDFESNLTGDVVIKSLNPKDVLLDPDGDEYEPDGWSDVLLNRWVSAEYIRQYYGEEFYNRLKDKDSNAAEYGVDAIVNSRERFAGRDRANNLNGHIYGPGQMGGRFIRLMDYQVKQYELVDNFVNIQTGEMRPIPSDWDRNRVSEYIQNSQVPVGVVKRKTCQYRWMHVADNVTLHDEISPYRHLTVVPYFPFFLQGMTKGVVEDLLDTQELLNKTTSQELHVVNTTANSGYIVKQGSLVNMDSDELADRGAETGLVIEVTDDVNKSIRKIEPNQMPTGLDRMSYKAQQYMSDISNVSESILGQNRADDAAKAVQTKVQQGEMNFALDFDNMNRTMTIVARNVLDLVQVFWTAPRVVPVVTDEMTNTTEYAQLNQPDDKTGGLFNDLTAGEYLVAVSVTPARDVMEDSEFEQALAMRKDGVQIPDDVIIRNSRLRDRGELIRRMQEQDQSPEAQAMRAEQARTVKLQNDLLEAEVMSKRADALARTTKAQVTQNKSNQDSARLENELAQNDNPAQGEMARLAMEREKMQQEMDMAAQRHQQELIQSQEQHEMGMRMQMDKSAAAIAQSQASANMKLENMRADKEARNESGSDNR